MSITSTLPTLAIIGAGPAALFLLKSLCEEGRPPLHISIFEKDETPGMGMPYSPWGAGPEHITNVSANEIPEMITPFNDWLNNFPANKMASYNFNKKDFHEYKVLPRLLFGEYLAGQFEAAVKKARQQGCIVDLFFNTRVKDIKDQPGKGHVVLMTANDESFVADQVVICTGHRWPKKEEGKTTGWFDSPYPPAKLRGIKNTTVAIKGASLTAVDAIRTLARCNGYFVKEDDRLVFKPHEDCAGFRMVMHSLHGLMPAVRFHLQDTHLSQGHSFDEKEIYEIKGTNNGFVPLDLVFDKCFKQPLKELQPALYALIENMRMEDFVDHMMGLREKLDGFTLLKAEYREAGKSIERKQSIPWKEMLAVLSYEMNYPAKHFCAEDMIRLKKKLMPLIGVIIAFLPQASCEELIALHEAGVLQLQEVDETSEVKPSADGGCVYIHKDETGNMVEKKYQLFINAVGQQAFMLQDFVFPTPVQERTVTGAQLKFLYAANAKEQMLNNDDIIETSPGDYWLKVPGIQINDHYQVLDAYGIYNPRIQVMAVPYIAGLNPDYSGLDFCERAAGLVSERIPASYMR